MCFSYMVNEYVNSIWCTFLQGIDNFPFLIIECMVKSILLQPGHFLVRSCRTNDSTSLEIEI